jgi:hypothetical protein
MKKPSNRVAGGHGGQPPRHPACGSAQEGIPAKNNFLVEHLVKLKEIQNFNWKQMTITLKHRNRDNPCKMGDPRTEVILIHE